MDSKARSSGKSSGPYQAAACASSAAKAISGELAGTARKASTIPMAAPLVVDHLKDVQQPADMRGQPDFLVKFPLQRLVRHLIGVHIAARQRPFPFSRFNSPLHQQNAPPV